MSVISADRGLGVRLGGEKGSGNGRRLQRDYVLGEARLMNHEITETRGGGSGAKPGAASTRGGTGYAICYVQCNISLELLRKGHAASEAEKATAEALGAERSRGRRLEARRRCWVRGHCCTWVMHAKGDRQAAKAPTTPGK